MTIKLFSKLFGKQILNVLVGRLHFDHAQGSADQCEHDHPVDSPDLGDPTVPFELHHPLVSVGSEVLDNEDGGGVGAGLLGDVISFVPHDGSLECSVSKLADDDSRGGIGGVGGPGPEALGDAGLELGEGSQLTLVFGNCEDGF